ncbi:phytoene desaturase family protein (plasmid) [Mycobacterium sp. TJFP1]
MTPAPTPTTDAVVIGSGHNGLIAANYLTDAGLRVRVVERRDVIGGATVTEEVFPGYFASTCSYVSGLLHPKILRDLRLHEHGLHLYQRDISSSNILLDGRSLFMYNELGPTLNDIERVAPGESEKFVAFGLRLEKFARLTGQWLLTTQPPTLAEVIAGFYDAGEPELFTEFFGLSVDELVNRYFSSDIVKGLLTFLGVVSVWGGPLTPGWAYVYGHHAIGEYQGHMGQFAFPRGGMGSIAKALAARATARGATITTNAAVERINTKRGRVTGVDLATGETIDASIVVSNADPITTYLKLLSSRDLPDEFVSRMRDYDVRGSMARVFLALDKLPQFVGRPPGVGPEHLGLTLLGAEVDSFTKAATAQAAGTYPDTFPIELIIQSAHDDTMAPTGKHILSTGIQQLPFELTGTTWDKAKPAFTATVIDNLEAYAPGIRDTITDASTITPLDLEREYGLPGGNIFHGAMRLGQLFDSRPVHGVNGYRAPIAGLYLCGAGTHPGGGVMGTPGHNAAHAVLADKTGTDPLHDAPRSKPKAPLVEKMLANQAVRKASVRAARSPMLTGVVDRLSRRDGS